jgi:hypothetical protein
MTSMSLPTPTLHTARLRLRPFDDSDANDLLAMHSSAYVLRYSDAPPWSERVRAERFITACRQMAEEGTGARPGYENAQGNLRLHVAQLRRKLEPDPARPATCSTSQAWATASVPNRTTIRARHCWIAL